MLPEPFERELIKLKDGGTIGLDWDEGKPDPKLAPSKPLLILIPGVAGDSDNMYQVELIKHVRKNFKIVTILFRGSKGVPITSAKIACSSAWDDIQTGVEYVAKTYCRDAVTGKKRCRFYAYGCSMGASLLGLYLINGNESAGRELDGAVLYGTPWCYH